MFNINIFIEVKENIDIVQAAEYYGITVKQNTALCPFHDDRNPSMSFKNGFFRCWSCDEKGSVIDLVIKLFDLSPLEAAKKLDSDFNLNINSDIKPSSEEINQVKLSQRLYKGFEIWEKRAFFILCIYLSVLENNKKVFAPKTSDDLNNPHSLFLKACHKENYIEHLIDVLIFGNFNDKINFFKDYKKEVKEILYELKKRPCQSA